MTIVGITGGMGSGKSVVSQLFRTYNIPVYIADKESKQLLNNSSNIKKQLIEHFGEDLYTAKGIDKNKFASIIFTNSKKLSLAESIIHPAVNDHFKQWASQQNSELCAIESAILFESGFNKSTDITIMVYAPLDIRIKRIIERDHISVEAAMDRINKQLSDEKKKELSDVIIYNSNDKALIPQVNEFVNRYSHFLKNKKE